MTILHKSRQLSYRGMCKIVTCLDMLDDFFFNKSLPYFYEIWIMRFGLWAHKPFEKWLPGLTWRKVLYSELCKPPSAILSLSVSSSCRAMSAKSTAEKYWPCNNVFRQCWAHKEPSCCKERLVRYSEKNGQARVIIFILRWCIFKMHPENQFCFNMMAVSHGCVCIHVTTV